MRVIDAHHHLWDLQACRYPWLMARGVKRFFGDPTPIQKNYLVADLRADAVGVELVASVHVQVGTADGDELRETEWLEQTAARDGLPSAIVAFCDLSRDDAAARIDAQRAYPSVRGVRQIVGRSDAEDAQTGSGLLLDDPGWRDGLALLADAGLSFDLQLVPAQIERAADVFERVDGLRVALCHCGSPWDQTPAGIRAWRAGLERLSELPGMHCKLSGLGMFDHSWTVDSVRPIVEACIEVFGVRRCMFGSNFPVDRLHATYAKVIGAIDKITSGLSVKDRERLFVGTAADFYRLAVDQPE